MTVSILGLSGLESTHLKPSLGTFQHYKALLSVVVHLVTVINYLCVEPVHLFLQNWSCECHRVDPHDGVSWITSRISACVAPAFNAFGIWRRTPGACKWVVAALIAIKINSLYFCSRGPLVWGTDLKWRKASRVRTHNQNRTVAARAIADMKAFGQLS